MSCYLSVYTLKKLVDRKGFEGFAFDKSEHSILGRSDPDDDFGPYQTDSLDWKVHRLEKKWRPKKVVGKVRASNDYPCLSLTIPVFSQKAVESLSRFLKPNGELLLLDTKVGRYYVYNLCKKSHALNTHQSRLTYWCDPPTTAVNVDYFEFWPSKVKSLSIFWLAEYPQEIFVTEKFVQKVLEHGLTGFEFKKVWPLAASEPWRKGKSIFCMGDT